MSTGTPNDEVKRLLDRIDAAMNRDTRPEAELARLRVLVEERVPAASTVTFIDSMKVHMGHASLEVEVNGKHYDIEVSGGAHRGFDWAVDRWEPVEEGGYLHAPVAGTPHAHGHARFFRDALQAAMAACRSGEETTSPGPGLKQCPKCSFMNSFLNGVCVHCGDPL